MKTTYLVTGAAGFLGSHVCNSLLKRGEKVRALVLKGDKAAAYIPNEVEIVEGNLCEIESLEPFFSVPAGEKTLVIHCASYVTINPDFNQRLIDINVGGTENMIMKCLEHKECTKMVYVSSTGAIPELPKGRKIKEVTYFTADDDHVVGWYSKSKAMATQAVLDAVAYDGLNACVVHPTGIMGPVDYGKGQTTQSILGIMAGEMPAGIAGSFNLCDVRDLADGCVAAAKRGKKGECYILGNEEITFKEFCHFVKRKAPESKIPKFFIPIRLAYLMANFMERQAKRKGKQSVMTNFAVYNLARNNNYDSSKAKRELGFKTRPYAETLSDQIDWIRSSNIR